MPKFRIYIGDWSHDGHGHSHAYLVSSNKPVEDVREAHYKIKDTTGIDIEAMCSGWHENAIEPDVFDRIKNLGFKFYNPSTEADHVMAIRDMARLWIFLLRKTDTDLELTLATDDVPSLQFLGYDEKGRHIGQVGYGLYT